MVFHDRILGIRISASICSRYWSRHHGARLVCAFFGRRPNSFVVFETLVCCVRLVDGIINPVNNSSNLLFFNPVEERVMLFELIRSL